MGKKGIVCTALCGLGVTLILPAPASAQMDRVSATEKGSLLIYSKVEIRWDSAGNVLQDTFVDMSNDYPEDVRVQMYFINGDEPLCEDDGPMWEREHPGWNWVDNEIMLTKNEPTYWSALTGLPKGVSPFTVLDPGTPPGRPADDGSGDRVLRGFIVAWAVNADGHEIRWNHLKGDAMLINYMDSTAWEYNAWSFQVNAAVAHGAATGTPGVLNLDGNEYALGFDQLLLDFYASDSIAFSGGQPFQVVSVDTDLTLHAVSADLRQESEGPVCTKAHFDVWNMNEVKFSGAHRCICCWDQTLLSQYDIPNHFLLGNLQTDKGKARIDGQQSIVCDYQPDTTDYHYDPFCDFAIVTENASLLGVAAKHLDFQFGASFAAAGMNLHGLGTQSAQIKYDTLGAPPESTDSPAVEQMLDEVISTVNRSLSVTPLQRKK